MDISLHARRNWWRRKGSNLQPTPYEGAALPIVLPRLFETAVFRMVFFARKIQKCCCNSLIGRHGEVPVSLRRISRQNTTAKLSVFHGRPSGKGNRRVFRVILGTLAGDLLVMLPDRCASWRIIMPSFGGFYLADSIHFLMNRVIAVSVVMCRWCSYRDSNAELKIGNLPICHVNRREQLKTRVFESNTDYGFTEEADFSHGTFRTVSMCLTEGKSVRHIDAKSFVSETISRPTVRHAYGELRFFYSRLIENP